MMDEIAGPYLAISSESRAHGGAVGAGNGLRRNPVLRQVAQRRLGLPLRLMEHEEEAAIGAARLAAGLIQGESW